MLTLLVVVGAVAVIYGLLRLVYRDRPSPFSGGQVRHWEDKILLLTRGNRGAMERSVAARQKKFPEATRLELLKLVHDDYVKDRE